MELAIAIIMWVVVTGMFGTYSWKAGWKFKTILIVFCGILLIFVTATVAVYIPWTWSIMQHSGWVSLLIQWSCLYHLIKHPRESKSEALSD